jgi:hypothetical protein
VSVTRWSRLAVPSRVLVALALVLVLVLLSIPVLAPAVEGATRSTTAQPVDLLEVSDSCVAVGQHISITVWGSGFENALQPGSTLTLRWAFAGVGADLSELGMPFWLAVTLLDRRQSGVRRVHVDGVNEWSGFVARPTSTSSRPARSGRPRTTPGPPPPLRPHDPTFAVRFLHIVDQPGW